MLLARWRSSRWFIAFLTLLWLTAIGGGFWALWNYASTPGGAGEPPCQWPAASKIALSRQQPTLVMFVHPKCPCTRASIGELGRLMTQCQNRLTAHLVFLKPPDAASDWYQTDLWHTALDIPGVHVHTDDDKQEAACFAAKTSGFVLLYAGDGRLLFQGGITGARGHEGENAGRLAVVDLVNAGTAAVDRTSVFGCPLCATNEVSNQ